ncbi:unnamed protein product [Oreochromis niloticus]|nr:unnamed protein product [Mustela putorius furo]
MNDIGKMERRTDTLSRIDEILQPVEDLEKRIRDRIFNGHLESGCSGPRVAVENVTAFRETPRDSLHPLAEFFGEVQPQRELSLASSLSSDGSSMTTRDSRTPEELRAVPLVKTPSPPPPFAPCPPSSSPPHRSQIPVRLKNYRETDKEVAGGVRLVTAQRVVRALEQMHQKIVDAFLPQTSAARLRLLPSRAPAPPGSPVPAPPRVPAPRAGVGAGARARVVALTPARAPAPPGAPVPAPPRVPAPRAGVGAGARARVVALTPARAPAPPGAPVPAPPRVPAPRAGVGAGARARVVALTPARAPAPPGAPVPAPPRVPAPRAGVGAGARARVVALTPARAPAPPGAPVLAPPRVPAPRAGRGAGVRARVVALTPARAPAPPGAPVLAPPRVPAPRAGRGAGVRARVVALTPARAPAPPGAPVPAPPRVPVPQTGGGAGARAGSVAPAPPAPASPQAPSPERRTPRRVVRQPPEVDFKGLIVGYLLSIDEKLGEELQPVSDPSETLQLSLSLLSQDDWKKKMEGLRYIRTLARHHRGELELSLHTVCLGVTQEIKNNRSCVSFAALDTVVYLCVHLKERMDREAEWTCESLLQVFARANANVSIQQHAKEALTALVHGCSPSRFLNSLVTMGLKHKSVLVRAGAALGLLIITKFMEAEKVLSAGQTFTKCFLLAVSELCQDASSEVRAHGKAILKDLVKQRNFRKMWKESVSDKSRCEVERRLRDVFQK